MSLGDAKITAYCDTEGCGEELEMDMTPLAGGGWDARNIKGELKRNGWAVDGDTYKCDSCIEAEEDS